MQPTKTPYVLMILDGFGYNTDTKFNAIAQANTPNWDRIWEKYPHTFLNCSGETVGLPAGQMGNSEVGHMNIGAGRVIYQDLTRIDNDIKSGNFLKNQCFLDLFNDTKNKKSDLHIIGLISDGGVHSHLRHYLALAKLAKLQGCHNLYIHAFLDGRDTPPKSALDTISLLDNYLTTNNLGKVVSIIGRYYAMDRDKRWERTDLAFNLLTNNFTLDNKNYFSAATLKEAVTNGYSRNETDEFIKPTIICSSQEQYNHYKIKDNDNVVFMNFRADRARQISSYLTDNKKIKLNKFVTLTEYTPELTKLVAYRPEKYSNMLGEFLQNQGLSQLRIAETEKYAHVTFFFNGGHEQPFENEDRILIPSPKVATYDLKPEMSAYELTEILCKQIESGKYDVIICNYANADMVGHTGLLSATIKAIEAIDNCLGKVETSIVKTSGHLFITADHGNAECMYDEQSHQPHTAHTNSVVPLAYVNTKYRPDNLDIAAQGTLQDIAPTMLSIMGYKAPKEMTGKILFNAKNE